MKVGLTGSTGFVGGAVLRRLLEQSIDVLTIGHRERSGVHTTLDRLKAADASSTSLAGCDAVLHLGARVHVMRERLGNPLEMYRAVNVGTTVALAQAAARDGVKRFVFVSSIKVNGETTYGRPFAHNDAARPEDFYGMSKREAEDALQEMAARTGIEIVVVRPPLVYGPGVKANFASLMRAVQHGIPLPLGGVTNNRRSFVALDNLVDLLVTCIDHPAAVGQTFLVSDGEDLSTTELLRRMGSAMERPTRLIPVPPVLLKLGATVVGKGDMAQRLLGSLQVDITHTRRTLDWTPPVSVDEGLRRAAQGLAS